MSISKPRLLFLFVLLCWAAGQAWSAPNKSRRKVSLKEQNGKFSLKGNEVKVSKNEPWALIAPSAGGTIVPETFGVISVKKMTNPPVLDVYVWSGAISTDWHTAGNWLVNSAVATGTPNFGFLIGNHVQIPVVGNGRYPVVTVNAGARSLTIAAGASVTVASGGKLRVSGSDADGVTNAGTFTNNGITELDSAFRDGFINQAGASLVNTATFSVDKGTGSRLKNSSTITNSGNFTVKGGLSLGFYNYPGAKLLNTTSSAVFNVESAKNGGVSNEGKIDNAGTLIVSLGDTGPQFINADSVINRVGATFEVKEHQAGILFDNKKYLLNEGSFIVSNGGEKGGVYNRNGAKLLNTATASFIIASTSRTNLRNEGYVENNNVFETKNNNDSSVVNKETGSILNNGTWTVRGNSFAIFNQGSISLAGVGTFDILNTGGSAIKNLNSFLTSTGCTLKIESGSSSILNEPGALFVNNCNTSFKYLGGPLILNKGRFTHLNGSIVAESFTSFIKNEKYMTINVPVTFTNFGTTASGAFDNSDTLIVGPAMAREWFNTDYFIKNSGYMTIDGQQKITMVNKVIDNSGTLILPSTFGITSFYIGQPIVNSGMIQNDASLVFSEFGNPLLDNTGTFYNNGRIEGGRSNNGVKNNGGTIINAGVIEIDTVGTKGIEQLGTNPSFTNTATGKILLDMISIDGIGIATGTFTNNGEILIAQTDSLASNGINNASTFINYNLIRIGKAGQKGILNTGTFTNAANSQIFITMALRASSSNAKGIDNQGTFVNQSCASIESRPAIVNTSGTFNNEGTITKKEDGFTAVSNISNNTGTITNQDTDAFNVSGTNTPLVFAITSSNTAMCAGETRTLTTSASGAVTFAVTGPATVAGNVLTITGGGDITVTATYAPAPSCIFTATQTITGKALPNAGTISPLSVCVGNIITLTSNGLGGGTWNGNNNSVATVNPTTGQLTGVSAGFVQVSYQVSSNGCSNSATVSIQVKALPTLTVTGGLVPSSRCPVVDPVSMYSTVSCGTEKTVVWYDAPTGGSIVLVPNQTPLVTKDYYVACKDVLTGCESAERAKITFTALPVGSTPTNVSLTADGQTVPVGQSASFCDLVGAEIAFSNACPSGQQLLISVDGAEYSATIPTQMVDGNNHNYRVRCQAGVGIEACIGPESGAMTLRIYPALPKPTATIAPLSICSSSASVPFLSNANCGNNLTVWYNAATNQPVTLSSQTPTTTSSYYVKCQSAGGCMSEASDVVTFTVYQAGVAPVVSVIGDDNLCAGQTARLTTNCPAGSTVVWNTNVNGATLEVSSASIKTASYSAKCVLTGGCETPMSAPKVINWRAFSLTVYNVGSSQSGVKSGAVVTKSDWSANFITPDAGPSLEKSTQNNPTVYFVENVNKIAPRYWTIEVETCNLGTDGSITYNMSAAPETGVVRSYNTHENNAPYFMYANRDGFRELYAQNHPAYGFYLDNGSGGNVYDVGLPKGSYKLGIRYWDMKGWGSIYPSTRQAQGNVLAYQEFWFRIQSKDGIGVGGAREAAESLATVEQNELAEIAPNPVSQTLYLKVKNVKGVSVNLDLIDISGRKVLGRSFVPESNQHQEEFDVSQMVNGMYFLRVNAGAKQTTLKVLKMSK
ncbi:MAG: T9SS type A sorting domain-containing protein [Bacteroidetes bacterium]|nr:T9SS type A sorting domain-containing protein [Bacteroidota bacterium]